MNGNRKRSWLSTYPATATDRTSSTTIAAKSFEWVVIARFMRTSAPPRWPGRRRCPPVRSGCRRPPPPPDAPPPPPDAPPPPDDPLAPDFDDPALICDVLSFSPDAAAICCSAGTAFCVAPFHRAWAPGADMPALVC